MFELSDENVERIFSDCLCNEGEKDSVKCEGVAHSFLFSKNKLSKHKEELSQILLQLPSEFMENGGGGYSFLYACNNKNGEQWTGLHFTMEKLFALGIGIEKVKCLLPKEVWPALPGGVPYYVVLE